jgi:hypothetical protein
MPLNPNDLEGWMANPEEWVNTEDKDDEQWQFELRVSLKMSPICIFLRESVAMCRACPHDPREPVSRVRHTTTREGIRQCQWYEAATRRGLFAEEVLKNGHLLVYKTLYKRKRCTALLGGALIV